MPGCSRLPPAWKRRLAATEPARRRTGQVIFALGTTQTLAWASSDYLPAILAEPMAQGTGTTPTMVFAAVSASLLIAAMSGPAIGRAIDARGGRGVLVASNLVFIAGLGALALARGPVALFAAWAVLGVGMSLGLYDSAFATLAGLYGNAARGPITGITLFAGFASTIGWPLSAVLAAHFGWRGACLAWAGLHTVLGLPLNIFLVPRAPPPAPRPEDGEPRDQRREMVLLAYVFASAWFVTGAMATHLPQVLQMAGAGRAAAIGAAALVGPAQVMARIVEFLFLRRTHPLIPARIATALHPLGVALLALWGAPLAVAFSLLYGAGNGILTIARGTLPLAIFGPHGYGARTGWLGAPARAAQALAPLLFGLILDRLGLYALLVSAGLCLSALAALFMLRPAAPRDGTAVPGRAASSPR